MERWQELKTNENYCPAGELRETLRETLKEEMAPTFDVWHDIEARVNGWDAEKKRRVKIAIES
jgi:hypothetical protein